MKRGFTLVELLGTIVILSLIVIVAFPAVISQLKKSNETIDSSTLNFVEAAARNYIKDRKENFPKALDDDSNKVITHGCVTVTDLISEGYLEETFGNKHEDILERKVLLQADAKKYIVKVLEVGEEDQCNAH